MWEYDSAWMWLLMVILWVGLGLSIVVGLRISRATLRPSARVRAAGDPLERDRSSTRETRDRVANPSSGDGEPGEGDGQ